jgi:hypothetical protein
MDNGAHYYNNHGVGFGDLAGNHMTVPKPILAGPNAMSNNNKRNEMNAESIPRGFSLYMDRKNSLA